MAQRQSSADKAIDKQVEAIECPACGNPLSVDNEAEKFSPTADGRSTRTIVRVEFCSACEYVAEIPR